MKTKITCITHGMLDSTDLFAIGASLAACSQPKARAKTLQRIVKPLGFFMETKGELQTHARVIFAVDAPGGGVEVVQGVVRYLPTDLRNPSAVVQILTIRHGRAIARSFAVWQLYKFGLFVSSRDFWVAVA